MPNPRGQLVCRTASGGLSIRDFYVKVFEWNERAWKSDTSKLLTDGHIETLIREAFPSREWSKGLIAVARYRAGFNRGVLTPGSKPKNVSYRYSVEGGTVMRWEGKGGCWPRKPYSVPTSSLQVTDVIRSLPVGPGE